MPEAAEVLVRRRMVQGYGRPILLAPQRLRISHEPLSNEFAGSMLDGSAPSTGSVVTQDTVLGQSELCHCSGLGGQFANHVAADLEVNTE
jgi:hypothetical protein